MATEKCDAPRPSKRARRLLAVFAVGLALRIGYSFAHPPAPPVGDALGYQELAVSLVERGEYRGSDGARAARPPGYPLFLGAIYATLGRSSAAVIVVQSAMGALACLLIAFAAEALLGAAWLLPTGLAAAGYYGLIEPTASLMSEAFYSPCLAAAAAALAWRSPSPWHCAVASGLALAVAGLTRPEALPPAGVIIALARLHRSDWGRSGTALALAALLLPVALWAGRNTAALGTPIPTSTRGGISLYVGLHLPLTRLGRPVEPFFEPPPNRPELEADGDYRTAFSRLWKATPAADILRAYTLNLGSVLYPFLPAYDITYAALAPLCLLGLAAAVRRPPWRPAAFFVASSLALYMVFGGPASRYRQGFAPFFILLAGLGSQCLFERFGARRASVGLAAWGAANLAVFLFALQARDGALWLKGAFWG